MPYIKQEFRPAIEELTDKLGIHIACAGDMNFTFTKIIDTYLRKKKLNYANLNEVMGALECCKLEIYRRLVAPYENYKIGENGDVFQK